MVGLRVKSSQLPSEAGAPETNQVICWSAVTPNWEHCPRPHDAENFLPSQSLLSSICESIKSQFCGYFRKYLRICLRKMLGAQIKYTPRASVFYTAVHGNVSYLYTIHNTCRLIKICDLTESTLLFTISRK